MLNTQYDTERLDYEVTTQAREVFPNKIKVLSVSSSLMAHYQKLMSKAIWRPAPGRKLGFLVVQGSILLGLIFLASPVIRLSVRDDYLFKNRPENFNFGKATRNYMDMSVCVATQPLGWYWNLGKLMALIAPTLGDYIQRRYPDDQFLGITTTSLYGKGTQYNRIYKFLGYTKGFGHEHISDEEYEKMMEYLRRNCPHCTPNCANPLSTIPKPILVDGKKTGRFSPKNEWCVIPYARFGDGSNARMRRISAYYSSIGKLKGTETFFHGHKRGVYYHPAIDFKQRQQVIDDWFIRWGVPRWLSHRDKTPPYLSGIEGGQTYKETV